MIILVGLLGIVLHAAIKSVSSERIVKRYAVGGGFFLVLLLLCSPSY